MFMIATIISAVATVILLILAVTAIHLYNTLIARKNDVENMMGSIDAILKKRSDLIPNLVSVVQNYAVFERSLMEKLTALRAQSLRPDLGIDEKSELSMKIGGVLREFAMTVENYPDLKANASFLHLQRTIAILEEELSAARRVYNQAVTDYNDAREMFPSNLVAQWMKLEAKSVFKASDVEKELPDLKGLFES